MDILIICQNYPPERGAVWYTYNLANVLAVNHSVRVITGIPHYPYNKPYPGFKKNRMQIAFENKVEVVRVPLVLGSNNEKFKRILGFISFVISVLYYLRKEKTANLIIASIPPPTLVILAVILKKRLKASLIFLTRDIEPLNYLRLKNVNEKFLPKIIIRDFFKLYRNGDSLVTIHKSQLDELREHGFNPKKLFLIPHSIDLQIFDEQAKQNNDVKLLKNLNHLLGVYSGTIGLVHDVPKIIKYFSLEKFRELPIDIIFFAEGEYLNICKRIVADEQIENIKFFPFVRIDQVPHLLSQADFLISLVEPNKKNFPSLSCKNYEYFASGKPILVSSPSYSADLIKRANNGWSFNLSDENSLYESLLNILSNRNILPSIGNRGRLYAEKEFSFEVFSESWSQLVLSHLRKSQTKCLNNK